MQKPDLLLYLTSTSSNPFLSTKHQLPPPSILKIWRQPQDFQQSYAAMKAFTGERTEQSLEKRAVISDEFWLLQHPDVYTLGQAGLDSHLLRDTKVPIIRVDRGGQITYHGPGQIIIYCLIDLKRLGLYVREFVARVESAIIQCLADYGLIGFRHQGAPGIYTRGCHFQEILEKQDDQHPQNAMHHLAKIAALGLKISHGCSYHGLALNVDVNLKHFLNINPCGYEGLETIDMKTALQNATATDQPQKLKNLDDLNHLDALDALNALDIFEIGQKLANHLAEEIYRPCKS